jgi:DNA-directed RNA polymerase beta subunit
MSSKKSAVLFSPQVEIFTPFAGHVDASRLNMSSKQINQVVISKNTEYPFAIEYSYKKMTNINSPFCEYAEEDGYILFNDLEILVIYYTDTKRLVTKSIPPVKKLINNSLSIKYRADLGAISKGDLLYDYTNLDIKNLMPRIGYRARILFSSFFGYTSDDAIVISESFAKKASIEYSQKVFIPITKEWKYLRNEFDTYFYGLGVTQGEEALVKYFNIDAGEHFMSEIHNLEEEESMFFTKNIDGIKDGTVVSIKVHRNTDKKFSELKTEYMYTPGLINEVESFWKYNDQKRQQLCQEFEDVGMRRDEAEEYAQEIFEGYCGVSSFNKHFETKLKEEFNLDPDAVDFLLEVTIKYENRTTRGDKFTNLFAGKGTVSMIIPDELMPIDPTTNKPIEIIFNPLGIFGRNNWGVVFELGLSKIADDIQEQANQYLETRDLKFAKGMLNRIRFVAKNFIRYYDIEYHRQIVDHLLPGIISAMDHENLDPINKLADDIKENGFYIFAPNFPEVSYTDFYHALLKPYAEIFKVDFGKSKVKYSRDLIKWLREVWHFSSEFNMGEEYETEIEAFVGSNYMLKLYHTSFSKFTSVSLANSYSKITGQPTRGRKKQGGQHISWQTLAALLGHKEHNAVLKELYTIKSDAPIKDKEKFLMQYITHGKYHLKPKYTSLTKRAVNNALKILGMEFND